MRRIGFCCLLALPLLVGCATTDPVRETTALCALDNGDNDVLFGRGGNDRLSGGPGIDVALFSGNRESYIIVRNGNLVSVNGPDGIDILDTIELLFFDDAVLNLYAVISQPRGPTTAVLDRIPVWHFPSAPIDAANRVPYLPAGFNHAAMLAPCMSTIRPGRLILVPQNGGRRSTSE